jgi:hypothetical protein
MDACACVAAAASSAHESSTSGFISVGAGSGSSADCLASALLIMCAVADFNIRSSSLLRAALAAAIACCCPRGRILLASAAFPCDIWGGEGQAQGSDDDDHVSSGAEEAEFDGLHGGMSLVARAIKGLGGVRDVSELIADQGDCAGGRVALGQAIGGGFISQLMQVDHACRPANSVVALSVCSQHFTSEPSAFKALVTSFSVLQVATLL